MSEVLASVGVAVADSTLITKAIAQRTIFNIDRQQDFASNQVASMANWLMASLLAINGGGALATVTASKDAHGLRIAGLMFATGVGSALMSAVKMQDTYNGSALSLSEQGVYWAGVAIYGRRDETVEQRHLEKANKIQRWSVLPPAFGWLSGVFFMAGTILLVLSIERAHEPNDRRCAIIQQEMLTDALKRPSDVQLFTALGCTAV